MSTRETFPAELLELVQEAPRDKAGNALRVAVGDAVGAYLEANGDAARGAQLLSARAATSTHCNTIGCRGQAQTLVRMAERKDSADTWTEQLCDECLAGYLRRPALTVSAL